MPIKRFLSYLFVWVAAALPCSFCQAQAPERPDLDWCFDVLEKNRHTYNQYNDSIFLFHERGPWINFFRRRAVKNHQIYLADQQIIKTIQNYFGQDKQSIPAQDYQQLYDKLTTQWNHQTSDPFLSELFCDILEDYYQDCPDSLNHIMDINILKGLCWHNSFILTQDTADLRKAVECFKRNMAISNTGYPSFYKARFMSLNNLTRITLLVYKQMTIQEFREYQRQLVKLLEWSDLEKHVTPKAVSDARHNLQTIDEQLIRNVYLVDSTVMDKHSADSIMRQLIQKNLTNKNLTDISFHRTLLMQTKCGMLTYEEARRQALSRYQKSRKTLSKARFTDHQLQSFLQPFNTIFYLNDMAQVSLKEKQNTAHKLCQDIITAFRKRSDQQYSSRYIRSLITLATYPRCTKYLTSAERMLFLDELIVATHITTYAHSAHVALLAQVLMDGVIRYRPELLIGASGYLSVSDIKRHRQELNDYIRHAAMYHDLGKNFMISVVNNDYRPTTDHEFAIIKKHPEFGLRFLAGDSTFQKYHDTTLGHHKWYNGKAGYPAWFDNTQSPRRIMIDIITLCDCMQAATERLGRNYKGEKQFETLLEEFKREAGTRYNPELVSLLERHPDVTRKMKRLVIDGWLNVYFNIYHKFFR